MIFKEVSKVEILAGLLLIIIVSVVFYLIAKKLNLSEINKDNDSDDFSCH